MAEVKAFFEDNEFQQMLAQAKQMLEDAQKQTSASEDGVSIALTLNRILNHWKKEGEERAALRFHLDRELRFLKRTLKTAVRTRRIDAERERRKEEQTTFDFITPPGKR